MFINKSSRLALFMILCLSLMVLFTGCSSSGTKDTANSDPYKFYDKVTMGQTKSDVDKLLGVTPEEQDGTFIYVDKDSGFGVQVSFDASDIVSMKAIYHPDESKIAALSGADVTKEKGAGITEGMTYDEVKNLLGSEGLEVVQAANPADPNTPVVMMIWFNKNATGYYIAFVGEKGTVSSINYYE